MITGEETHLDHMRIMKKTAVQKQARKRAIHKNLKKEEENRNCSMYKEISILSPVWINQSIISRSLL